MTAKEQLRQLRDSEDYIQQLLGQIEELHTQLTHITPILSDMPVCHGNSDKMVDGISKMLELKAQLNKAVDSAYDRRCEMVGQVNRMQSDTYKRIIALRYLGKKQYSFEEIATAIGYSYYRTVRMHGAALQEFTRVREGKE